MRFGDIVYVFAFVLFAFMTFVIIRNYFRSKFDDEGKRKDMQEDKSEDS
jgi:hypothetical protein